MGSLAAAATLGALAVTVALVLWLTALGAAPLLRAWRARREASPRGLKVVSRRDLTEDVFEVALRPVRPWGRARRFMPGQHIVLDIPMAGATATRRAYSLAAWAGRPRDYVLAIKREAEGAASRWLHDELRPGANVRASHPKGGFHAGLAAGAAEVALVAGGIGITPMRAMLQGWAAGPRPPRVTLHFSARQRDRLFFDAEFAALQRAAPWFTYAPRLTKPPLGWNGATGRLTARDILAGFRDPTRACVLMCANRAMEDAVVAGLAAAGFPGERVHRESFGIDAGPNDIQATVTFRGTSFTYAGAPTLLHALIAQSIDIPAECRAGECGLCRVAILAGTARSLIDGGVQDRSALACCAVPAGDLAIDYPAP